MSVFVFVISILSVTDENTGERTHSKMTNGRYVDLLAFFSSPLDITDLTLLR